MAGRELGEFEADNSAPLHAAEIKGRRDYFDALARHMARFSPSDRQSVDAPAMRRVDMRNASYVILPDVDDWVIVNEGAAAACSNVFVLEVLNGGVYSVPHFVYFSDDDTCTSDEIADAVAPIWPRISEIQTFQVVPAYDRDGVLLNMRERDSFPTIGVFRILDSTSYGRFNEAPYGAMVYRGNQQ